VAFAGGYRLEAFLSAGVQHAPAQIVGLGGAHEHFVAELPEVCLSPIDQGVALRDHQHEVLAQDRRLGQARIIGWKMQCG
jgi:hypothetical protein